MLVSAKRYQPAGAGAGGVRGGVRSRSSPASGSPLAPPPATSGGGRPPPPPAGSGGGRPPPPPSLSPSLHSPAALRRPRSAVSCSGFAAALHFRGSLLSSGSACRPRWLPPPRTPPAPAPAGSMRRVCVCSTWNIVVTATIHNCNIYICNTLHL